MQRKAHLQILNMQLCDHTWKHLDYPDALLTQEVPNLNDAALVCDVGVDGKMGIHKPHLVLKALCHSLNHVLQNQPMEY